MIKRRLKNSAKKVVDETLPLGSRRRKLVKKVVLPVIHPRQRHLTYEEWVATKEAKTLNNKIEHHKKPLISIIVPCYNTSPRFISELVDSIAAQSYPNWQLCLIDGGSTAVARARVIEKAAAKNKKITYLRLDENLGIAGNTNKGIEQSKGQYIAFLDHDDLLPSWALNEVVHAINKNPKADIFYSDEDKLSDNGKERIAPFFKPDWSPDLFLGVNYMAHFVVVRSSLVHKVGGLSLGFDGAQDYDFLLKLISHTSNIVHIPKILYHWRMTKGSTARAIGEKNYVDEAGKKALTDYFRRNNIQATVVDSIRPTNYRIRYDLPPKTLISIIIPFKDKADLLKSCVSSIKTKTNYKNYELILISNNSVEPKTHEYLDRLKADKKIKIYKYDLPFNYSAINNFGRSKAKGEVLVFLNNDTEVISSDWLNELGGVAHQNNKGAVGPMLLYPDKKIQHAGVIVGLMKAAGHIFRNLKSDKSTFFGAPAWPRNYLSVTGACLAVEAKKFDQIGGFDEKIIVAGSDVVLCLDLYKRGYLNVYWPYVQLFHYESKSVGSYKNIPPSDYERSIERYRPYLGYKDPYFNPNLDINSEWPKLRVDYEKDS